MADSKVVHSTFVVERKLNASPEHVFASFSDATSKRQWFFESANHELLNHELEFKVGGRERAQMKMGAGPIAGMVITNDTVYEDIQTNQRIVSAYRMSLDGRPFSAALATIELVPAGKGTDLVITHQGAYFEGSDGPEMRKQGWEHLVSKLVKELGE